VRRSSRIKYTQISFGIEFEANSIGKNTLGKTRIVSFLWHRFYVIDGWDYQADPTVTFELRSPVWLNINEAVEDIKKEFTEWIKVNNEAVPFFRPTRGHPSVGGHIHIGKGKEERLNKEEANSIIRKLLRFLPFLYFINANGKVGKYISLRMTERPYTPLKDSKEIHSDRREEFWLSDHGTIEFRRFDANVPSVQLSIIFLIQEIIKNAREEDWEPIKFQSEVKGCLLYPPDYSILLEVRNRFREIEDVDISNLPEGIKEVLILSFVFLKNPSLFQGAYSYEFSRNAVENCGFLLSPERYSGEKREIVKKIKEMSKKVKTLKELLDTVILDSELYYVLKVEGVNVPGTILFERKLKIVENYLQNKDKKPSFLPKIEYENLKVRYLNNDEVMFKRIKDLNSIQLDKAVNMVGKSLKEIIEEVGRYYFKVKGNEVLGYFVVNVPEGKLEKIVNLSEEEVREVLARERIKIKGGG